MSNLKADNLQPGDILSETTYYQVQGHNVNGTHGKSVRLTTSTGTTLAVTDSLLEQTSYSSSQFTEEKKLSKTELAQMMSEVGDTVFEVSFQKQPAKEDIQAAIAKTNNGQFLSNKQIRDNVEEAYKGETRVLRGYLLNIEPLMGRAKVVDLDVRFKTNEIMSTPNPEGHTRIGDNGIRLIDLRTLNYLIYKGVKYSLKK